MSELALSRVQAAESLGLSLPLLDRLLQAGELRHTRVGRRVLIPREAVGEWLRRRTGGEIENAPE